MVWSLKSIPSSWEKAPRSHSVEESMISENSQCEIKANGKFIPINSVTAKLVYNLCISHKFSPPISKKLLSTKFNIKDQKPGPQFIYYPLVQHWTQKSECSSARF